MNDETGRVDIVAHGKPGHLVVEVDETGTAFGTTVRCGECGKMIPHVLKVTWEVEAGKAATATITVRDATVKAKNANPRYCWIVDPDEARKA